MKNQPSFSRRSFLSRVAVLGVAGTAGTLGLARYLHETALPTESLDLETASRATFAEHVGSTFLIQTEGGSVEVRLTEATDLPNRRPAPSSSRTPFRLGFRGVAAAKLEQATYQVEHARLGTFNLFVVPVGMPTGGVTYEAIFA